MEILTSAFSDKGGRLHNEDNFEYNLKNNRGVWIVADGLGGMAGGELASGFVAEYIKNNTFALKSFNKESLLDLMNNVNRALIEEQKKLKMKKGMRTTVAAAFMEADSITSIHFGDSRFYYFRNHEILYQSRDHSMSQVAVDLGEIELKDIRFHEDRSCVLKVLGNDEILKSKTQPFTEKIKPGDAFLLCTDGFWELTYEEEMIECLQRANTPQLWLENMLNILSGRMTDNSDNFTAICCIAKTN